MGSTARPSDGITVIELSTVKAFLLLSVTISLHLPLVTNKEFLYQWENRSIIFLCPSIELLVVIASFFSLSMGPRHVIFNLVE